MKRFALFALLPLCAALLNGCIVDSEEPGTIQGTVVELNSQEVIPGVCVRTEPATSVVMTDNSGLYRIENVEPENYRIIAYRVGYEDGIISVKVSEKKTASGNVTMRVR